MRAGGTVVGAGILLLAGLFAQPAVAHPPGDLAFYKWNGDGDQFVFRAHPDGSQESELAPYAPYFSDGELAISPDGDKVAFYGRGEFRTNIYVQGFSDAEPIRLTSGPRVKESPAWSPDGKRIVADCGRQLCVMRSNGAGDPRNLTHNDYGENSPEWAPSGRWIAFTTAKGIMKIRPDGSGLTRLTRDGSDSEPIWSPDSKVIVFNRRERRSSRLFRMHANGDGVRAVTDEVRRFDEEQDWAPDGSRLTFIRSRYIQSEDRFCLKIWTIKPNGAAPKAISDCFFGSSFSSLYPAWSPDSDRIAYITGHRSDPSEEFVDDVFSIKRDGSDRRQVTHTTDHFDFIFGLDW
jgi:Tol biopolymer transport system component